MTLHCLDFKIDAWFKNPIEKNMIHCFIGDNAFVVAAGKNEIVFHERNRLN